MGDKGRRPFNRLASRWPQKGVFGKYTLLSCQKTRRLILYHSCVCKANMEPLPGGHLAYSLAQSRDLSAALKFCQATSGEFRKSSLCVLCCAKLSSCQLQLRIYCTDLTVVENHHACFPDYIFIIMSNYSFIHRNLQQLIYVTLNSIGRPVMFLIDQDMHTYDNSRHLAPMTRPLGMSVFRLKCWSVPVPMIYFWVI